jgi:epsilon-lactone hydrolase
VSVPASAPDRVILYLHGGTFCVGSPSSHRPLVARICAASGARALSLDYRLAPEHPFPAALEDAAAAYRWLRASGVAPARMVFAGDSAGANIVLAALIMLRDAGEPLPAAAVCISAPLDLTATRESLEQRQRIDSMVNVEAMTPLLRAYIGGARASDPLVSPLLADLSGLPPLLVQVGGRELLCDDAQRFARKAADAGVDVTLDIGERLWHVWHIAAPYVPEATAAISRIGQFLRRSAGW